MHIIVGHTIIVGGLLILITIWVTCTYLHQIAQAGGEFPALPIQILQCLWLRDGLLGEGLGDFEVHLVVAEDIYHTVSFLLIFNIIKLLMWGIHFLGFHLWICTYLGWWLRWLLDCELYIPAWGKRLSHIQFVLKGVEEGAEALKPRLELKLDILPYMVLVNRGGEWQNWLIVRLLLLFMAHSYEI